MEEPSWCVSIRALLRTVKLKYASDIGFSLIHRSVHYKSIPLSATSVSGQDCGRLVTVINITASTTVTDVLLLTHLLQLDTQMLLIKVSRMHGNSGISQSNDPFTYFHYYFYHTRSLNTKTRTKHSFTLALNYYDP